MTENTMPTNEKQPRNRLALPSAMGTATVLFHFLFCMLLSSVLPPIVTSV